MQVLFIAAGDETSASSRYRVHELVPHLEDEGVECDVSVPSHLEVFDTRSGRIRYYSNLALRAVDYDAIYIQKVQFRPILIKLLSKEAAVIYDFDDALYATPPWETDRLVQRKQKLDSILEVVPTVVTGSRVLSEYAERFTEDVTTLPTALPRTQYDRQRRSPASQPEVPTLGWIGNPENLWYLEQVEDVLTDALDSYEGLTLDIITSTDPERTPLIGRTDVRYREWSREAELDLLNATDVGIRPLTDDMWTRGKGGFTSIVQCMALGKPVVASPVGTVPSIVDHGKTGFLASSNTEWRTYLEKIIEDRKRRVEMSGKTADRVEELEMWAEQRAPELAATIRRAAE